MRNPYYKHYPILVVIQFTTNNCSIPRAFCFAVRLQLVAQLLNILAVAHPIVDDDYYTSMGF